jgi:hypothetical protein
MRGFFLHLDDCLPVVAVEKGRAANLISDETQECIIHPMIR